MKIRVIDDLTPEDSAMLQALYSRSAASVDDHLAKVTTRGSGQFMKDYVAGYNHKSIADCGDTDIFIEGVSLLAAKAVQATPMYSGQETSTRYIDMLHQDVVDPVNTAGSSAIIAAWMKFYGDHMRTVEEHVRAQHPRQPTEKGTEADYERAVKARAFDIMRGFLPAGIQTQLSWSTNLRQAGDHVAWLVNHPSSEVATLGRTLRELLISRYPSSGFDRSLPTVSGVQNDEDAQWERRTWEKIAARQTAYLEPDPIYAAFGLSTTVRLSTLSQRERTLLITRPRGCAIPHAFGRAGTVHIESTLDFGSFRDLQRHRPGVCRMPLLTTGFGFHEWYLAQLPESIAKAASDLLYQQHEALGTIDCDPVHKQYLIPLGYVVPVDITYPLPGMVYLLEMRSAKTIHPTLRQLVLRSVKQFEETPELNGIPIHADRSLDDWTIRRGQQTIHDRRKD